MAKKKNSRAALRSTLIVLSIVLGLVLALLVAGTVYADYLLGKVNYVDKEATMPSYSQEEVEKVIYETEPENPDFTGPELTGEEVVLETAPVMAEKSENVVTILLLGADRRKNEPARTDTIILCTFNKTQKTITLTSLLRDMYVRIPGYKSNRINATYVMGGASLLEETLEHNFGIEVDGYVEVDFSHFAKLIDLLGGIELEVTGGISSFIYSESGTKVKTGLQKLNGEQALHYARYRGTAAGDLDRTNRQRVVLTTLLNEYKSKSMTELLGLLDDILPMVTTDLTQDEILDYFVDFFPMLADAQIVSKRIPTDDAFKGAKIDGMSVLVPDIPKCAEELHKILSEYGEGIG